MHLWREKTIEANMYSRIMQKLIHRLTVSTKRLLVKLEEFDLTVQKSQKYLFHIDPTSDRLVDSRGRTRVEHQLGRASRTVKKFGYPDLPANATYRYLNPADVNLGDKWLMVGNDIEAQIPPSTTKIQSHTLLSKNMGSNRMADGGSSGSLHFCHC